MATLKRTVLAGFPAESNRLKRTLYIGGLDDNVDKTILHAAFIPFGELRTVEIPKDRATGKHRGFGFVEFEEEDDAGNAIDNMNEAELYGRILTVNLARTPARRPGEGSKAGKDRKLKYLSLVKIVVFLFSDHHSCHQLHKLNARFICNRISSVLVAVWADDSFLRQRLVEETVPIPEEDLDLVALLKCGEAQEALKEREDAKRLQQAQGSCPLPSED